MITNFYCLHCIVSVELLFLFVIITKEANEKQRTKRTSKQTEGLKGGAGEISAPEQLMAAEQRSEIRKFMS